MPGLLQVELSEDGADAERVDFLARNLREELLSLDVEGVQQLRSGAVPPGARAFDAVAAGALIVSLVRGVGGLRAVVDVLKAWLKRDEAMERKIRLEIAGDVLEISNASSSEQAALVDAFIVRHGQSGSDS